MRPGALRALRGFVIKEVRHILRDWQSLLILVGMPLVQVVLFGSAIRSDVRQVRLAIVDPAPDAASASLRAAFEAANGTFVLVRVVRQARELEADFATGRVRVAVNLPVDFGRQVAAGGRTTVEVIADAGDPNTGAIMDQDARAVIGRWAAAQGAAPPALAIVPVARMRFNPTLASVNLFVPGLIAYVLTILTAMMTAITVAREKETGTMEMLLASPLRPWQVVAGKVVPYIVLSAVNVLGVLLAARVVFGVPVRGSLALLLAECLLYMVTALAMGILISTQASSQRVAMLAALAGLMLPTLLLSGFIFPIAALPRPLQLLSNVIPARWFIVILRGIMLKGAGLTVLWRETLVLAGLTTLLLVAGVRRLATRLA
jgi:ABC-2 type transport system permease protein